MENNDPTKRKYVGKTPEVKRLKTKLSSIRNCLHGITNLIHRVPSEVIDTTVDQTTTGSFLDASRTFATPRNIQGQGQQTHGMFKTPAAVSIVPYNNTNSRSTLSNLRSSLNPQTTSSSYSRTSLYLNPTTSITLPPGIEIIRADSFQTSNVSNPTYTSYPKSVSYAMSGDSTSLTVNMTNRERSHLINSGSHRSQNSSLQMSTSNNSSSSSFRAPSSASMMQMRQTRPAQVYVPQASRPAQFTLTQLPTPAQVTLTQAPRPVITPRVINHPIMRSGIQNISTGLTNQGRASYVKQKGSAFNLVRKTGLPLPRPKMVDLGSSALDLGKVAMFERGSSAIHLCTPIPNKVKKQMNHCTPNVSNIGKPMGHSTPNIFNIPRPMGHSTSTPNTFNVRKPMDHSIPNAFNTRQPMTDHSTTNILTMRKRMDDSAPYTPNNGNSTHHPTPNTSIVRTSNIRTWNSSPQSSSSAIEISAYISKGLDEDILNESVRNFMSEDYPSSESENEVQSDEGTQPETTVESKESKLDYVGPSPELARAAGIDHINLPRVFSPQIVKPPLPAYSRDIPGVPTASQNQSTLTTSTQKLKVNLKPTNKNPNMAETEDSNDGGDELDPFNPAAKFKSNNPNMNVGDLELSLSAGSGHSLFEESESDGKTESEPDTSSDLRDGDKPSFIESQIVFDDGPTYDQRNVGTQTKGRVLGPNDQSLYDGQDKGYRYIRRGKTYHYKHRFSCPHCPKKFVFQNKRKHHVDTVHKNIKYKCDTCNDHFNYLGNLKQHIRIKHNNNGAPINCRLCEEQFTDYAEYSIHRTTHSVKRDIICPNCNFRFTSHMYVAGKTQDDVSFDGSNAEIEPLTCKPCKFKTKYLQSYRRHLQSLLHQRRVDALGGGPDDAEATDDENSNETMNETINETYIPNGTGFETMNDSNINGPMDILRNGHGYETTNNEPNKNPLNENLNEYDSFGTMNETQHETSNISFNESRTGYDFYASSDEPGDENENNFVTPNQTVDEIDDGEIETAELHESEELGQFRKL